MNKNLQIITHYIFIYTRFGFAEKAKYLVPQIVVLNYGNYVVKIQNSVEVISWHSQNILGKKKVMQKFRCLQGFTGRL